MESVYTNIYSPQPWETSGRRQNSNRKRSGYLQRSTAELIDKRNELDSYPIDGEYQVDDGVLRFNSPYNLTIKMEDGHYVSESSVFKTFNAGLTKKELVSDFIEDLYLAWKIYVDCSEDELTEQARVLRKNLQEWLSLDEF